jgi:predicted DNA-binding WGR domain protein
MTNHYYWTNPAKQRFYYTELRQDMLGWWVVACEWGGMHSRLGNAKLHAFLDKQHAIAFIEQLQKKRQQRGYKTCSQ